MPERDGTPIPPIGLPGAAVDARSRTRAELVADLSRKAGDLTNPREDRITFECAAAMLRAHDQADELLNVGRRATALLEADGALSPPAAALRSAGNKLRSREGALRQAIADHEAADALGLLERGRDLETTVQGDAADRIAQATDDVLMGKTTDPREVLDWLERHLLSPPPTGATASDGAEWLADALLPVRHIRDEVTALREGAERDRKAAWAAQYALAELRRLVLTATAEEELRHD